MVSDLEALFPRLQGADYRVTSPSDRHYNCIAWAAGDRLQLWWPDLGARDYWPESVPRAETLSAFQEVFALLGYAVCEQTEYEPGFEKIALFTDPDGIPTHAARQLLGGRWTSKLGALEDIEHALHDLTGTEYGRVALIMRRPLSAGTEGKVEGEGSSPPKLQEPSESSPARVSPAAHPGKGSV